MRLHSRRMLAALAAMCALLAAGAAGAQAKVTPLTGTTTFTPSPQATQFLADHGVTVAPTGEAIAEDGAFVFPIAGGFATHRFKGGLLAHKGGLEFTKGERSAVVRNFVAVRVRRAGAVLLAQLPGLRGGCGHLRAALARFALEHPRTAKRVRRVARHLPGSRRLLHAVREYCSDGRVIVLARLTNLSKELTYNSALLTADLKLSAQAARLINKVAGERTVRAGAPLGTAESRVTVVR
jgi:hypothetical protein